MLPGLPWKSLGTMLDLHSNSANRIASSSDLGVRLKPEDGEASSFMFVPTVLGEWVTESVMGWLLLWNKNGAADQVKQANEDGDEHRCTNPRLRRNSLAIWRITAAA